MRHPYEFNGKRAQLDDVARHYSVEQGILRQVVLFKLALCQTGSKVRTVNGDVEFFQQVRQRAQLVFVPVREDDRDDALAVLFKELKVGDGNIDAESALLGKTHTRVEDDHLVPVAHGHAIHPELADTAERYDL